LETPPGGWGNGVSKVESTPIWIDWTQVGVFSEVVLGGKGAARGVETETYAYVKKKRGIAEGDSRKMRWSPVHASHF